MPDEATKATILNAEFNTYVMAVHAKDLGLDQTKLAQEKKGEIERRVITEEYLNQEILDGLEVDTREVIEVFLRFNSVLRASHLYAASKEEAHILYERLQNGEKFEDLAREVFQSPYLKENGGDLGEFTTDEMDVMFENTAFNLEVDEISHPIQTAQGYSIIKLTDKYTKPIITEFEYASKKPQLEAYALKKKRELASRAHFINFMEGFQFEGGRVEEIFSLIENNMQQFFTKDQEFLVNGVPKDWKIGSFADFNFFGTDFLVELTHTPLYLYNNINDKESLRDFISALAYRSFMMKKADSAGITQQKDVLESTDQTYLEYLANESRNYLRSTISNSESELQMEYRTNRARFDKPLEVNVARIVVETEEIGEAVIEKAKAGIPFVDLVKEYTIANEELLTNGELGFEFIDKYGYNSTEIAKLDVNEISEVLSYQTGEFHIYKMLERKEASFLSFKQARDKVDDFLTDKKLKLLEAETVETVKAKHNATINLAKLNELTIQL